MRRSLPLSSLTIVLLLAACTQNNASSSGSESPAPESPTTAEVAASPASDKVLVSGTAVCDFTSALSEQKRGSFSIFTGTMACTEEMSDPRVSGRDEFNLTQTQVFRPDVAWFSLEDQVLTTEGGTWRGGGFGSEFTNPDDGDLYTSGHSTLVGEGAYKGLVYRQLYYQSSAEADHYFLSGWIEPAA